MKKLSTLIALICISSIIHSCKKDFNSDIEEISTLSDTSWARVYYKKLIKEQGRKVTKTPNNSVASISSVKIENFKHTIWKKAYYSESNTSNLVEIPLLYNRRSALIKT
ncbi:MAG: hypothetical protein K9I02_05350 [Haliscomenobacter sp.]|nr:hypothetical protein [Haliscomenobacter sp.]